MHSYKTNREVKKKGIKKRKKQKAIRGEIYNQLEQ